MTSIASNSNGSAVGKHVVTTRADDQASALRRFVHERDCGSDAARDRPTLVAITSGKGGVGKTNLAVNAAISMQARGAQVTLVDLDVGLANADVLLDVNPRHNLREVVLGRRNLVDVIAKTANGLSFIAGTSGSPGFGSVSIQDCRELASKLSLIGGDVVLLDCAAGISSPVICFASIADAVLVVTTPEPTAMTDAYATIKTLVRGGYTGSIRLLVNMVESRPEAKEVFQRLRAVCEKFLRYPVADAGYMLHDTHVELAVRQRSPFVVRYPRSSASACVSAVAARLMNGTLSPRKPVGLLGRVAGMFM